MVKPKSNDVRVRTMFAREYSKMHSENVVNCEQKSNLAKFCSSFHCFIKRAFPIKFQKWKNRKIFTIVSAAIYSLVNLLFFIFTLFVFTFLRNVFVLLQMREYTNALPLVCGAGLCFVACTYEQIN